MIVLCATVSFPTPPADQRAGTPVRWSLSSCRFPIQVCIRAEVCARWGFHQACLSRVLLGTALLGTRASRPHRPAADPLWSVCGRDARVPKSAVPAQVTPWGETRRNAPRTDSKPRKNAVSVGVENISTPSLHPLYQEVTNSARGSGPFHVDRLAAGHRCPSPFLRHERSQDLPRSDSTDRRSPARTASSAWNGPGTPSPLGARGARRGDQASMRPRSFFMAFFSIWRIRSADTPYSSASSWRVAFSSASHRRRKMDRLRSSRVSRAS